MGTNKGTLRVSKWPINDESMEMEIVSLQLN